MKNFTIDGIEYSVKQAFGSTGKQYRARYQDGTEAWAFIAGSKHTRQQVVNAILEVNEREVNEREF